MYTDMNIESASSATATAPESAIRMFAAIEIEAESQMYLMPYPMPFQRPWNK
jgi:hypothetical protein